MPIDTKPEEKIIYGAELEAAVTDGIQRAIGRRIGNLRADDQRQAQRARGLLTDKHLRRCRRQPERFGSRARSASPRQACDACDLVDPPTQTMIRSAHVPRPTPRR